MSMLVTYVESAQLFFLTSENSKRKNTNVKKKMSKFKVPNVHEITTTNIPSNVKLFTESDFDRLKQEIANTDDYTLVYSENGNTLWQKVKGEGSGKVTADDIIHDEVAAKSSYLRYKYCCDFDCDMDLFIDTIRDYTSRHEWDDRDIGREIVHIFHDPNNSSAPYQIVEHMVKRGQFVVANREFISLSAEAWDGDVMYSLGRAIDLPDVKTLDKSAVMSYILYLGQCIEKLGDGKIRYWCVSQTDAAGWIPGWVVNWACKKLPEEFQKGMNIATQLRLKKHPDGKSYTNYYQIKGKQYLKK
jgi:hypothetical protein